MLKSLLLISSLAISSLALTQEEFNKQQIDGFYKYKQSQEDAFKEYQKEQMKALDEYKKEVGYIWSDPKLSTKKEWVSYTDDKKTRTIVDFSKESIKVETIASSLKEAEEKLKIALAKTVTIDTKTVQETDPLEKKLAKIKKPKGLVDAKVKPEPIISTLIFKTPPTKESVKKYVNNKTDPKKIKISKSKKITFAKIYTLDVKLPKNSIIRRSKIYYKEVKKQAAKQKLPISLIFAIMHSESSFNPRARSYVPAYGLMQIVPKTAGIDTYHYLYKKKKLVSSSYLYNSTNNITMGSAYLHILYYKYLKKIKNPRSRLYCTIAAYNTGAGNIAWAFTKTHNINKAAPIINKMTPDEVYAKLLKDLRWDEPKHYLKKVSRRMSAYHKIYGA
jgi:membrane-bound lytic murein transglycosylase C